mmetsp:Transcript_36053/g.73680  ORF Transcript_36053/g.73680 Transcript_36053/m.73680 type:complete len:145 (+) Transcript_36053:113-547(+)
MRPLWGALGSRDSAAPTDIRPPLSLPTVWHISLPRFSIECRDTVHGKPDVGVADSGSLRARDPTGTWYTFTTNPGHEYTLSLSLSKNDTSRNGLIATSDTIARGHLVVNSRTSSVSSGLPDPDASELQYVPSCQIGSAGLGASL